MSVIRQKVNFHSNSTRKRISQGCGYILLILLSILFIFPIFWLVSCSLKTYEGIFQYPPQLIQFPLQFQNYPNALTYETFPFITFILNSVWVTVISVIGAVLSSSLAGYTFARLRWRGRNSMFTLVVLTMIIPT